MYWIPGSVTGVCTRPSATCLTARNARPLPRVDDTLKETGLRWTTTSRCWAPGGADDAEDASRQEAEIVATLAKTVADSWRPR